MKPKKKDREYLLRKTLKLVDQYGLVNVSLSDVCEAAKIPQGSFANIAGEQFNTFMTAFIRWDRIGPPVKAKKSRVHKNIMRAHLVGINKHYREHIRRARNPRKTLAKFAGVSVATTYRFFPNNEILSAI